MIETERLILRRFAIADAEDVWDYLREPSVHCFLDMKLSSLEEAKQAMKERESEELYLAIVLKETGKVIGEVFASCEATDPTNTHQDTYSPCWMINPAFHGKGYGFEAVRAYLDMLFKKRGARRIYMYTEDYNTPCQKLCEKLGARQEGLYKEFVSFIDDENGNPIYENTYEYAILKKEWRW